MKKRSYYPILCLTLAIIFLGSTGLTFASWKVSTPTVNMVSMGSVTGKIIEVYEQGQTVYPDATVSKVVQVKNTGNIDSFVRVSIEKAWGESRDSDGDLIRDTSLSTDNIIIQYDNQNWYYNEKDGYYYYLNVLKPDETTKSLFESFYIDGSKTGAGYNNKQADIIVTMEMVQAGGNGMSYWSMTPDQLGITYTPSNTAKTVTTVNFKNPQEGFKFEVNDGDLFANFKNLIPGESRSQEITVTNDWSEDAEIFLHAEIIDQSQATKETKELIEKLLKKYATITVTDENGKKIYSGPVWGNPTTESPDQPTMKNPYSLGNFSSKETKSLYVSLYLDEKMDNEYKDLLGKIKWVFSAEGAESSYDGVVKTGDMTKTLLFGSIAAVSGILLIFLTVGKRKKQKE